MNFLVVLGVLIALLVYTIVVVVYAKNSAQRKELESLMSNTQKYEMKTFHYEDEILKKLQIKPNSVKFVIYVERFIVVSLLIVAFYYLRGLALAALGAIVIAITADQAYKKVLYESGITNIPRVMNFINYFVPHINSGNSADQSFLGYVEYSGDEDLASFYENRDNPDFKLPAHLKQIVDIYDIAKYNEEKGISNYTYILNELSEDMSQKQIYYNSFVSRISEIKPICWSYYIAVPLLICISFKQTLDFWMAGGGYLVSIVLLALFAGFKFLIYRLQKKTIETIF